ncbi:MAG TPA: hypothetical protein VIR34_11790 [Gemmatimonadaceae bacterium]|jgi:hypothetical protein
MTDKRKGKKQSGRGARASDADRSHERASSERDMDREALREPRSDWQERNESAAGDQMTPAELRGMDLLGRASVRNGAIEGVSEPSAESGIDRPPSPVDVSRRSARRTNPPLSDDALGDGGISSSGGVAGGARGGAGKSSSGAGTPEGYQKAGPGEQKSTSRFDLDGGTLDEPEE